MTYFYHYIFKINANYATDFEIKKYTHCTMAMFVGIHESMIGFANT